MLSGADPLYAIDDTEEITTLLQIIPDVIPDNWLESEEWLEKLCTLATLSDNEFVWHCVFIMVRQAVLKPGLWKFLFPFLNEIQRPVTQYIVRRLARCLIQPGRRAFPFCRKSLCRHLFNLCGFHKKVFWPHMLLLLKELSEKKRSSGNSQTRKIFLRYANSLSWNSCAQSLKAKNSGKCPEFASCEEIYSWGEKKKSKIKFLEALIRYQTEELKWIRELSESASKKLNKTVLTLHNASLGASSSWGIQDFRDQIGDSSTYEEFSREVQEVKKYFLEKLSGFHDLTRLKKLWISRLVEPKLRRMLHYFEQGASIGTINHDAVRGWRKKVFSRVGIVIEGNGRGKDLSVLPVNPEVMDIFLELHLQWTERKINGWLDWHALLLSLLSVGNRYLSANKIEAFVVPWTDKFFMSSKRKKDISYLEGILKFVCAFVPETKILFVDDTTKKSDPSLKLALPELNKLLEPLKVRGLGVFDSQENRYETNDPALFVTSVLATHQMVVISPCPSSSDFRSFYNLVENKDYSFLTKENYHSSWKDNLDFLYWGTSVFPLTDAINFDPFFPAYVLTKSGPLPFGRFYKTFLMKHARGIGNPSGPPSHLFKEYGEIAGILD